MVYFDTNVLIYAFVKNIDDEQQRELSISLVEEAIENDTLILSELILCEFAFISAKLNEEQSTVDENLEFLSTFLQPTHFNISQRMLEILKESRVYKSSFDVFHLAFSEYYNAKFITFDKGFKKLHNSVTIEIDIQ